jgi:exopolysaccharide production protein ExoQ
VALFAVVVLVHSTGAGFAILGPEAYQSLILLLWLVGYAVAAAFLLDGAVRLRTRPPMPLALLAFVALAAASTLWSEAPSVTMRRSFALAGTILIALALAQHLRPVDLFEALRRAMLVIAVSSLALYVMGDVRAVDAVHDTLRGVVIQKNSLGRFMAAGLFAGACVMLLDVRRWRRCVASAVPMIVALALTDSAGGLATAVFGVGIVGVVAMWRRQRGRKALAVLGMAGIGLVALIAPLGLGPSGAHEALGRDATLTGRTQIWEESLAAFWQRPLTGYGYGAFWDIASTGAGSDPAARIVAGLQQTVSQAHNGLLDVALALGISGVALMLFVLGDLTRRGLLDARSGRFDCALLRLSIGGLVVVTTIAESGILQENALLTLLLAVAIATPSLSRRGRGAAPARAPRRSVGVEELIGASAGGPSPATSPRW